MKQSRFVALQRRTLVALAVPIALAAGALAFFFLQPARSPLDALPSDSFAILTVDADAMRKSSLAPTFHEYVRQFARLPAGCNVDLSERTTEAALAVAEGKPELGLALSGQLTEAELLSCKAAFEKVESGAAPSSKATESDHGSFHVSKSTQFGKQLYIAWSRRGPLTLGIGAFTERMLDAVDGKVARVGAGIPGDVHGELRAALKARAKTRIGAMFTALPTAKLRADFADYVPLGSFLERVKPLTTISAFGIALAPGIKDGEAELLAEARCDDEALCEKVKELVLRQRFEVGKNFAVRLGGFGPLIDQLTVERSGKHLTLHTHDSAEAIARNLAQAKSFLSLPDLPIPGFGGKPALNVPQETLTAPRPAPTSPKTP